MDNIIKIDSIDEENTNILLLRPYLYGKDPLLLWCRPQGTV